MTMSPSYLEQLSREDCLRLLPSVPVGRVAYCVANNAHVVPVNFVVYRDEVVIRSGFGGKLVAAVRGTVVTFQADDLDPVTRTGWSVTVTGRARVLDDAGDLALLERAPLEPWAPGDHEFFVGIRLRVVTGRRIRRPGPASAGSGAASIPTVRA